MQPPAGITLASLSPRLLCLVSGVFLAASAWPVLRADVAAPIPDNPLVADTGTVRAKAVARWQEAKFGLFLHWGVYSVYGGSYQGRELWSAEWIQENARIPWEEYSATAAQWNPDQFDAEAWVRAAKQAGMGYLVVTAKHHDGFAMYPSRASKYNLMDWSAYRGPDPLRALKDSCRKHGLLFGIYYSPLEFRVSPAGFDDDDRKAVEAGFDYRTLGPRPHASNADVVRLAKAQIRELAENYRPDIFWFDGTWDKMGRWTAEDGREVERSIRAIVPDVLINNRLGGGRADFNIYEGELPEDAPGGVWEYCWNLGVFWGYNPRNYRPEILKTPDHYIETLVRTTSLGGNYLLNVGPGPDGRIPAKALEYLRKIGDWVRANEECLRGVSRSPFDQDLPWGYATCRPGSLYLIVRDWDEQITMPALGNTITRVAHPVRQEGAQWTVRLADPKPAEPFSVVPIRVDGMPAAD